MDFETLGLESRLIKAIKKIGFELPTPIQEQAIPYLVEGQKDLVGLAQTGTGKTAAFGLPMIQRIDVNHNDTQGLILCPTRELCLQITEDFKLFSTTSPKISIAAVYGGASIVQQMKELKKGAHIIVATPGRLLDLMNRKKVDLSFLEYLVLDEADEMLNMGFQEDLDMILESTPSDKQTWLFSATMPRDVARIASRYMHDPVEITVGKKNSGAVNIEHVFSMIKENNRYQALKRIIDYYPDIYGLIFCRTRIETQEIAEKLIRDGYDAEALHGDLSQAQRDKVMGRFREKNLQILVATDVAARGLDVKDITHVIHYKLPDDIECYTHRSGRTARAGKSGVSMVLINTRERRKLQDVERKTGIRFEQRKIPNGYAICEKQLFSMVEKLVTVDVNDEDIAAFLPPVFNTLSGLGREDLVKRFVSLEFNRFLAYYRDSVDINVQEKPGKEKSRFSEKGQGSFKEKRRFDKKTDENSRRFFASVGEMDNLNKGALVRLICDRSGIRSNKIGSIEIKREFSFFDVDASVAERVRKALVNVSLDGRKLTIDYADVKKDSGRKKSRQKSKPEKQARPFQKKKSPRGKHR